MKRELPTKPAGPLSHRSQKPESFGVYPLWFPPLSSLDDVQERCSPCVMVRRPRFTSFDPHRLLGARPLRRLCQTSLLSLNPGGRNRFVKNTVAGGALGGALGNAQIGTIRRNLGKNHRAL